MALLLPFYSLLSVDFIVLDLLLAIFILGFCVGWFCLLSDCYF